MNIKDFKSGDKLTRVEPARIETDYGICLDNSYMGNCMTLLSVSDSGILFKTDYGNVSLPKFYWEDGWVKYEHEPSLSEYISHQLELCDGNFTERNFKDFIKKLRAYDKDIVPDSIMKNL
jgi:hypothetical protein